MVLRGPRTGGESPPGRSSTPPCCWLGEARTGLAARATAAASMRGAEVLPTPLPGYSGLAVDGAAATGEVAAAAGLGDGEVAGEAAAAGLDVGATALDEVVSFL